MTTSEFIAQHRMSNPRDLALQSRRYPDVDMPYALNQIQGWQTARQKLPSWAACDGVVYPPHLNMEQCSSEPTARYKQEVVGRWLSIVGQSVDTARMADLTGGFGVDFSFTSRCFAEATYVERNESLCGVVSGNLPRLGISNARVVCAEAEEWLASAEPQTMLFLDPARRDEHGAKTVLIADCTPDVEALLPQLMSKSRFVVIKLSPMLDWHKAVADLQGAVREVHIVSVGGECKELLLVLAANVKTDVQVVCIDIQPKPDSDGFYPRSEFKYSISLNANDQASANNSTLNPQHSTLNIQPSTLNIPHSTFHIQHCGSAATTQPSTFHIQHSKFLYEPNSSVMKAGCFGEIAHAYGVSAVSSNSHLFLSADRVEGFPGREFVIDGVTTMNKRQLKQLLGDLKQANIAVRNFPLSVAELRKRLKLRDGGNAYIFATTTADGDHVLLVTHKRVDE